MVGHNAGAINNSYATGSVTGTDYLGGLVGQNSGTITNTYSTGAVAVTANSGGLVGAVSGNGTVTSSYWDTETSGQGTSAGGEGKTTLQMKKQATYIGWDFGPEAPVWNIVEDATYPYLTNSYSYRIGGTVYSDLGVTPVGSGVIVRLVIEIGRASCRERV